MFAMESGGALSQPSLMNAGSVSVGPSSQACIPAPKDEEEENVTSFDTIRDVMIIQDPIAPVWTIDDFEIARKLGQGQFGNVYLARERRTKYVVAIKAILKTQLLQSSNEHLLRREIEIHSHLIHPNILGFYGWFTTKHCICLIIEVALGELMDQLEAGGLPEPTVSKYMLQMISAIRTCHKLNVIHRDLKPENILLSHDGMLKLADFGWAAHIPDQDTNTGVCANTGVSANTVGLSAQRGLQNSSNRPRTPQYDYLKNRRKTYCGTLDYLSPEIVRHEWYGKEVDLWCLGVLCYELAHGGPPFPCQEYKAQGFKEADARKQQQQDIQQCSIEKRLLPSMSNELKDFLRKTLHKDPKLRMSTDQMIVHSFITKFNDINKELAL
ncbi:protein kinase, partial [Gregarina niphandrodes]